MFVVEFVDDTDARVISPEGEHTRIPSFVFALARDEDERDECARRYVRHVFQYRGEVAVLN